MNWYSTYLERRMFYTSQTRVTTLLVAATALLCAACQSSTVFEVSETTVTSRGTRIPVTFVHPALHATSKVPLVVLAHGHGGNRDESGAFSQVAKSLAELGIASIRMDFPGCGESSEPFIQNNLANMLMDVQATYRYATQHPRIDAHRIGMLGYSMGGRVALLSSVDINFSTIALWAPAGTDGIDSMIEFLGGQESYEALRSTAASDGFVPFQTRWGQSQQLSLHWFSDLEMTYPLTAVREFDGPLLVLYGENDDVIRPQVAKSVVDSAENSRHVVTHVVKDADHGLGFYDEDRETANDVVKATIGFLREHL